MASRSIKNRPSTKKKQPFIGLVVIMTVLVAVIAAGGVGIYALGESWISGLEDYDVSQAEELNMPHPSEVYASDNATLLAKLQLENRDPVSSLDEISSYVVQGTVATEDERFYEHRGVDLWGIIRAAAVTMTGSGREGASTITQQFVRNTILSDEMTDISLKRKVREMYLSVKMEEVYSKNEILLMYLNTINYGNGTYGIQAAAQRYFSKDATDLTLAEAATLIGIPQSPTYNEPLKHEENCLERRNLVLDRMLSNGYITQEEHDSAQTEELVIDVTVPSTDGIVAYPYFTSYVINKLQETYSKAEIFAGGLRIVTTLDVATQEAAEAAVTAKEENLDVAISGSLVAIDPDTGHVKALVGGKDYYKNQTNLATGQGTNGGRPCGSSFKTFTLIAALEAGINPQTMIDCSSPAILSEAGYPASSPLHNIDNQSFGTISMQRAFAKSSNTGFVRLQMSLGTDKVREVAERMGITSTLSNTNSLTLGTQNVTMLDMAKAYATIANGGTKYEAQPILEIYNRNGNLIADNVDPEGERVLSPEVAKAAADVMKTVVTDYDGTGTDAKLANGQEVAGKTGTSSDYMDITFCGITPQLSVAIWFGDPNNLVSLPEHIGAADVFSNFMNNVLEGQQTEEFPSANNMQYLPSYSDSKYHIGGYSSSSNAQSNTNTQYNTQNNTFNGGESITYSNSNNTDSNDVSSTGGNTDDSSTSVGDNSNTGGDSSSSDNSSSDNSGSEDSGSDSPISDNSGSDNSSSGAG